MYTKIHFKLEFRKNFWKKICWISFITGCGGHILIKSDFKVLNPCTFWELCCLLPTGDLPWTHKASQTPSPLKKKYLDKSLLRVNLKAISLFLLILTKTFHWNLLLILVLGQTKAKILLTSDNNFDQKPLKILLLS